jgi:putative aldouronate transport system permease protein
MAPASQYYRGFRSGRDAGHTLFNSGILVLPLSLPALSVVLLFYAVARWNAYFQALIYLQSRA